jgi:hypothetical protein
LDEPNDERALFVPVMQKVSFSLETIFYNENTCLGIELMKQVEFFQNDISAGFPRSSKSKVIFEPFLCNCATKYPGRLAQKKKELDTSGVLYAESSGIKKNSYIVLYAKQFISTKWVSFSNNHRILF